MPHDVAWFVHGRGRGHAARALHCVPHLRGAGVRVHVHAGREAREMLRVLQNCEAMDTCGPGPRLLRRFATRVARDVAVLRRTRPRLVVCDGDGPSLHAAAALGIPTVSVGHGSLYATCRLPATLPPARRTREALNAASSSWCATRRVVVHFAPAVPFVPRTAVARPDLPVWLDGTPTNDGYVLAYFRDGDGRPWLEHLVARGERVVLFGDARHAPRGVEVRCPHAEDFATHLLRCRAVISSAGNHLPAECGMLGKPLLATYARGDAEHRMNATLIEEAGIGVAAPVERADPQRVAAWLDGPPRVPDVHARIRAMEPASRVLTRTALELLV